jgi:phosphate acetyltransferase
VIPDPSSVQLCSIAFEASEVHNLISKDLARVAFLSFSTNGSAEHYKVKKVRDSARLFSEKHPSIIHEGEIQFDAAINKIVANKKNINSNLKGSANVFIFPDLDSGNISYKITQYLAGYQAIGPILIGLNKPVNDLSRGCSVEDIVYTAAVSALQT